MNGSYRFGSVEELKVLRESEMKYLQILGGEGSWLASISFVKRFMYPIFSMVEHAELEPSEYEGISELKDETLMTVPIEYLVYRKKKLVRPFTRNHSVKMSIEIFTVDDIDIVTVLFASYDNPTNPMIIESYFNPYYEDENGDMNFMEDIRVIANSSVQFFAGYLYVNGPVPELDGMTFVEYTPEFKSKAKDIYSKLQEKPDKRQSPAQFMKAKTAFQRAVPLNHRTINWLGDWRKLNPIKIP